ncbi:TMEM208 family protein [Abortiporus biennis]
MANASAKRVASQNAETVKKLRLGMIISSALSLAFRLFFRRGSLSPKGFAFWIYVLSLIPSIFLSRYLERIGSPRHDPTTGTLISAGEDLSRPGIIEWCFDVVYITWSCQIGSGAFGLWFWSLYLIIPLYAIYKLWGSFLGPMFRGSAAAPEDAPPKENVSKRQEKLRKRSERGDPRVRVQQSAR